jgi:hypothetical protein
MVVVACSAIPAKPSVCYLRIPVGPMRVLAGLRIEHATVTNATLLFTGHDSPAPIIFFMSLQRDPFVKTFGDRRELNATTLALARNVKKSLGAGLSEAVAPPRSAARASKTLS